MCVWGGYNNKKQQPISRYCVKQCPAAEGLRIIGGAPVRFEVVAVAAVNEITTKHRAAHTHTR